MIRKTSWSKLCRESRSENWIKLGAAGAKIEAALVWCLCGEQETEFPAEEESWAMSRQQEMGEQWGTSADSSGAQDRDVVRWNSAFCVPSGGCFSSDVQMSTGSAGISALWEDLYPRQGLMKKINWFYYLASGANKRHLTCLNCDSIQAVGGNFLSC